MTTVVRVVKYVTSIPASVFSLLVTETPIVLKVHIVMGNPSVRRGVD